MTAPVLAYKKFYIIKPAEGTNQIKNPQFSGPEYVTGWTASGAGVTIASHPDDARRGAYSMQVNTATGVASGAFYDNVTLTDDDDYTFSCDVKGTDGQAMRLTITDGSNVVKATTTFTATGYWQRPEVTWTSDGNYTDYRVQVIRDAVASTDPFYVDGVQLEQASAATTLIEGYIPGCRWEGYARNSASIRSAQYGLGGEIVDLEDYCKVVQVTGLGHGDWNQILTKMTSGGDMYQTHTRKSRNFSIIVDFTGNSLSEIETNRKAVLDLIRPDYLFGESEERRIIRYQGTDVNGDEATNPVDIVCVPLSATMVDTPDLPTYQRAILNFTIPSGLLNGAYQEGKELNLYADFPAEYIVKRDPDGNWCEYNSGTGEYDSLITGLNGAVYCMAEGPDGKIYVGGGFINIGGVWGNDYLARWNPVTESWEALISDISSWVTTMKFAPNGDLYIGGIFNNINGDITCGRIARVSGLSPNETPVVHSLGTGIPSGSVSALCIDSNGVLYAGGSFYNAGGVPTKNLAKWNGVAWEAVVSSMNNSVLAMVSAPNDDIYIGGQFTLIGSQSINYLVRLSGTTWYPVGAADSLNGSVYALDIGATGLLYVGGDFTNAGGNANADYIASWNGSSWASLGSGTNGIVRRIFVHDGKVYASGDFTAAGGLSLTDRVAVWSNGAWQPLDIDLPGTSAVSSILPASDGSLYIGGAFTTAGTSGTPNAETGLVALNLNVASASANTYPFMQVRGPGTLKAITNYSTGKTIAFDGLTLNAGEWINLFFDPLNLIFQGGWSGRGNLMRYVVPGSDYGDFYLKPGNNLISLFFPDSDENLDSGAFISWTPLFWGIDGALL